MPGRFDTPEYREVRQTDLAGGLNDKKNQAILAANEAPDCLNVDFDSGSVVTAGGAIKFNNQSAPGTAIECRPDPALSPLCVLNKPIGGSGNGLAGNVEVPLRGYGYLPYSPDYDIGGSFTSEGSLLSGTETFHVRRGRSFEINVSFQIPPEERLYEAPTNGANTPGSPGSTTFDQALDECFCIIQKGGDRTAPMSWALAVVNVGAGTGLSNLPSSRISNYALCFIWYDAPQWGEPSASVTKYNLTSGQHPTSGGGSTYATQAYRAILIHKYVEPGRAYSLAFSVTMDSGSCGTTAGGGTNTSWSHNGAIKVHLWEDRQTWWYASASNTGAGTVTQTSSESGASRLEVIRGPTDSFEYLCKYGIRYAGRDAVFLGLGQRFTPWARPGFIPFGSDCTPLGSGGFAMLDRSAYTAENLYGASTYTLQCAHTTAAGYFVFNHQGLSAGNTNGGFDPRVNDATTGVWDGLGGASGNKNANALRGYRLVATGDTGWGTASLRGAVFTIQDYTENTASYRLNVSGASSLTTWGSVTGGDDHFSTGLPVLVQCFRWHQRKIRVGQVKIRGAAVDYLSGDATLVARRKIGLRMSTHLGDDTDDTLSGLLAYWPCDDAGGGVLRERLVGGLRNGFLCPFANATTDGGTRGDKLVFLSGEGEALCLDLSANEVFQRELGRMQNGIIQGFGFELTCVFTEAFYPLRQAENLPDTGASTINGSRLRCVPDIASLDVKDANTGTLPNKPRQLLGLSCRSLLASTDGTPFKRPAGFGVEVLPHNDSENLDPVVHSALQPWYVDASVAPHYRYDPTAPWVGKVVTIQVGVQWASAGLHNVYIALKNKAAFLPESGDPADVEMQYWTDVKTRTSADGVGYSSTYTGYESTNIKLKPHDLARAVLTVGGRWNCKKSPADTTALGIHEIGARMLVDEVRWFAATPAGRIGAYPSSGTPVVVVSTRDGKLEGTNCLPPRELTEDDILQPLGASLSSVNVTQGSKTVTPGGGGSFFTDAPGANTNATQRCLLRVSGDDSLIANEERLGETREQFYFISSATSSALTLAETYSGGTRSGAPASVFRLVGYGSFEDDVRDRPLLLGRGTGYNPASVTVTDVLLTDALWTNLAPPGDGWRLRIYSPLGRLGSEELLPRWVRGLVFERRIEGDGILGIWGQRDAIYAGCRGSLYRADDRWREDGPTPDLTRSLEFLSETLPGAVSAPLHADMVRFQSTGYSAYAASANDSYAYCFDVWVKLNALHQYQTVMWVGDESTDPSLNASSSGHKFHYALRFNRGRPEFVFGSTAYYTGTTVPEKGLYVASSSQAVEPGVWTHIRWVIASGSSGAKVLTPYCKVMGKATTVTVNATETGLSSGEWLTASSIVAAGGGGRVFVGVGRDSYRIADQTVSFTASTVGTGDLTPPQRLAGFMHGLDGRLAQIMVTRQAYSGTPADFNPYQVDYSSSGIYQSFAPDFQRWGVGHKLTDHANETGNVGTIKSHPFISVFHEMGTSQEPMSFAEYGSALYCTNGGKPVVVIGGAGRFAGVPSPAAIPEFRTERFPLWKKNARAASSDVNDPVLDGVNSSAQPISHYNTNGNAYWRLEESASSLGWAKDGYFGLKFLVRPRRVDGRIQLWRRGSAGQGGPFFDIVDGKARFGWWDSFLKAECYVETSEQVFWPGYTHYVFVKKRWPANGTTEGNWENSLWSGNQIIRITPASAITVAVGDTVSAGGGSAGKCLRIVTGSGSSVTVFDVYTTTQGTASWTGTISVNGVSTGVAVAAGGQDVPSSDMLVVKRFRLSTDSALSAMTAHDAYTAASATTDVNCVSFTTTSVARAAGVTGVGIVSPIGPTFSGAASGVINSDDTDPAGGGVQKWTFRGEMVGMYFMWGSDAAAAFQNKAYRISAVNSTTQAVLVDPSDASTTPDFSSISAKTGQLFTGIQLIKSTLFDSSTSPDTSPTTMYFMGGPQQAGGLSGYTPFDGETWCPCWMVDTAGTEAGVDMRLFQNADATASDPMLIGTDFFEEAITSKDSTKKHQLGVTDNYVPWTWDCRAYGSADRSDSSQPTAFTDAYDSTHGPTIDIVSPTTAGPPPGSLPRMTSADLPFWEYVQTRADWAASRYIAVGFYDPVQQLAGRPGPVLQIGPTADDALNPSGAVRTVLTNLPVGRSDHQVVIYMSPADGSSSVLYEVARVESGTSEVGVQSLEENILRGGPAQFSNWEPPRCSIVASAQNRVAYAAIEGSLDAIVMSRPAQPGAADMANLFQLTGGLGDRVTGLSDLDGLLVAFKSRAMASLLVNTDGTVAVAPVSSGVGCVAHATVHGKDGVMWWLSDRGVQQASRSGVTNLSMPYYAGKPMERTYDTAIDKRSLNRACGVFVRGHNQYRAYLRGLGERRMNMAVSAEMRTAQLSIQKPDAVFSKYAGPNVTAVASVQAKDSGLERLVAGTEEGFLVWMDRADTALQMLGPAPSLWGFSRIQNYTASSLYGIDVGTTGRVDTDLEGPSGCVARYYDSQGYERELPLLGADGLKVLFAAKAPIAVPANTDVMFGAQRILFETGWLDMGNPERNKTLLYIDLVMDTQTGQGQPDASVTAQVFTDWDGDAAAHEEDLSLTDVPHRLEPSGLEGRWFKLRITHANYAADVRFDLAALVWRVRDEDQT